MAKGAMQSKQSPVTARPLSPHLQVWGWTVTMASSITHRATGVALYSGTILLAFWVYGLTLGPAKFQPIGVFLTSPIGIAILAGYVWALVFHLMNGLRHLYWDSGRGLNYATAKTTAWAVFVGSFIVAAVIVGAGLAARGAV